MRRMPGWALLVVAAVGASAAAVVGASAAVGAGAAVGCSAGAAVGAAAGAAVGAAAGAAVGASAGVLGAVPPQAARIGTMRASSSASAKLRRRFNRLMRSKLLSQASVPRVGFEIRTMFDHRS